MGVAFSVFATIAFAWTILHGLFSFTRWLREPTFEVLDASLATDEKQGVSVVEGGYITVVAFGGARTRRIVDWKLMLFERIEDGRMIGRGINMVVEPILETIPAHESTKLTLTVQPGTAFDTNPAALTGELRLQVDKYLSDKVKFTLHAGPAGVFSLDRPMAQALWRSAPWWKRAARWLERRL